MAVQIGASTCCLTTQRNLNEIAGGNVTTLKIDNFGMLQWVTSATNRSGFTQVPLLDPDGKTISVRVQYWTNPRTAASTSAPNICSTDSTTAQKFANVTAEYTRSVKLTLSEPQFRTFCGTGVKDSEFAKEQIMARLNQLFDGIDTDMTTIAYQQAGNFYGGVAPGNGKEVKLITNVGTANYNGAMTIANDMEDAQVVGTPAAIGLGYLRDYSKLADVACCDQNGIDLTKANTPWLYYSDRRVDTVIPNSQNFIVAAPGALQYVPVLNWTGPYDDIVNGTAREDQAKTNVLVQVPGGGTIPLDFTVYRPFCGDSNDGNVSWVLTWTARFGFWVLPSDLEAVGTPFESVNGLFLYRAICGANTCSDVPS